MGLIEQINALIWSWVETFRAFGRRVTLLPFVIYTAAQAAILAAIAGFAYPVVSWFMVPLEMFTVSSSNEIASSECASIHSTIRCSFSSSAPAKTGSVIVSKISPVSRFVMSVCMI